MQATFRLQCWIRKPAADPQAVRAVLRRVGLVTDDQRMKKRRGCRLPSSGGHATACCR